MNEPVLSSPRLAALRARLVSLERELAAQLQHAIPPFDRAVDVRDFKELAQDEALAAIDEVQDTHAVQELQNVQSALRRMDAGQYGTCTSCGEPIGVHRLDVLPATPWCAGCSSLHESQRRRMG